jgi:hypothetical protein
MTTLKKISVLALLCLISSPAWSGSVDFCKVKIVYDDVDVSIPPETIYEDCSGYAFYDYAINYVKAACWKDANNLLDGKCEIYKKTNAAGTATENSEEGTQETFLLNE